jgi:hypothetical protein
MAIPLKEGLSMDQTLTKWLTMMSSNQPIGNLEIPYTPAME